MMTISSLWARKLSPKENKPSPSKPVSDGTWTHIKARIPRRRDQNATDPETSRGTNVPTKTPCHEPNNREHTLLHPGHISSPRPLVALPHRPTMCSPSQDPLSLSPTSSSSRSALNDSPVSDMNSKCDYAWSAVPRAETLGAIGSTECYLPPSDAEANAGEVAKAVSSQHFPSVPSPDPIGFVERSEQRPTHEVDLAWTLGPFDAMDSVKSAGGEVPSSSAAAPVATTPPSHSRSYAWVIEAIDSSTQPTAEASMGTQSLPHNPVNSHSCHPQSRDSQASSSSSDSDSLFAYDYLLSALPTARRTRAVASVETQRRPLETEEADNNDFEELPNGLVNEGLPLARANDVGITGLAETGCRVVDGGWVKSAGDNEGGSSFPAAPTPPTAVLHFKPCNMVVVVTPPSPPTPMRSSESHQHLKGMGMNRGISRPALHHPQRANSTSQALRGPAIVAKPLSVKNYSRTFRPKTDQGIDCGVYVRPSKRTVSKVATRLVERTTDAQNAHVKNKALSTPRPLGPSGNSKDQLTFFDMLALGGSIDDPEQPVERVADKSAADEVEPSLRVEPIHLTLLSRRSAKVKQSTEEPTPNPVHDQVRALASRVTSSVSRWGKAVSRLFVRRPGKLEEATAFSPHFDPWVEGYVPPRGPSPDCTAPNDALEPSKSGIWNVYVKLDE